MKVSSLLTASLVFTVVLIATVAVFVRDGQGRLQEIAAAPNVSITAGKFIVSPVGQPGIRVAPVARHIPSPAMPHVFSGPSGSSNSATKGPSASQFVPHSTEPDIDPAHDIHESHVEIPKHVARASGGNIPRWVTHPQAAILHLSNVSVHESLPVVMRDPAVENLPAVTAIQQAATAQDSPRNTPPTAAPVPPVSHPLSAPPPAASSQTPWPQGSFTVEEERYRAQFGWAALAARLRDEALNPDGL